EAGLAAGLALGAGLRDGRALLGLASADSSRILRRRSERERRSLGALLVARAGAVLGASCWTAGRVRSSVRSIGLASSFCAENTRMGVVGVSSSCVSSSRVAGWPIRL